MDSQSNVIDQNNIIKQSHISINNIADALNEFDASSANIVKITAFYQSREEPQNLHENRSIRNQYINHAIPQSTCIPPDYLDYQRMLTEFEVIAMDSNSFVNN